MADAERDTRVVDDFLDCIHFVEFQLAASAANTVGLAASFNGWKSTLMPLHAEKGGTWRVVVPLPPGTYAYAFDVDSRWTLDPGATSEERSGRSVSIRRVP